MTTQPTPTGHAGDQRPGSSHHTLLTLAEAAALLRISPATLRWWRHNRTGPRSFKLGRWVMYDQNDINDWIEAQRRGDGDPATA